MATPPSPQPSFSPRQKWAITVNVALSTIAAFAILVGINYLSSRYETFHHRFYLSKDTRVQLSPKTLSVLKSLTNDVDITVYYDKKEPLYRDIMSLLEEYRAHSHKLKVRTIDYYHDLGPAVAFHAQLHMGSFTNKDFVLFESNGRHDSVPGSILDQFQYIWQPSTNADDSTMYIRQKRVRFNGEMLFTAKIFAVTQARRLNAYFLKGHGERSPTDVSIEGSSKLAEVFHRNYVDTLVLDNLLGTNSIPPDCSLLVIDGPQGEFQQVELDKISQYLDQGGRLFALFDQLSASHNIGLEKVLEKWNVRVTHGTVLDPTQGNDEKGQYFGVSTLTLHDVMKPIIGKQLEIVQPRPIARIKPPSQTSADEPLVTELAYSSTNSVLQGSPITERGQYPLMVAVEKSAPKGVVTAERGATRMLITGDAYFLDNQVIDYSVNSDFADAAVNWLLERTTFLEGVGPRPVSEYQLLLNPKQTNTVKWLLLAAIPGGILLFGSLVWLRRRK
jgi:ABC-2 type transport system permease protein